MIGLPPLLRAVQGATWHRTSLPIRPDGGGEKTSV